MVVLCRDGDGIGGVDGVVGEVGDNTDDTSVDVLPHHASHSGSPPAASHLHRQCLFGFLVAIYPGHLFEFLKCSVWFSCNN